MVAPIEMGEGGIELLVGNGLLKQYQAGDRVARPVSQPSSSGPRARAH